MVATDLCDLPVDGVRASTDGQVTGIELDWTFVS